MFLVEIMPDFKKVNDNLKKMKQDIIDVFKGATKEAEKLNKTVASVASGIAQQRKFVHDRKHGDSLAQMASARDSGFRKTLNQALQSKMLGIDDFRGSSNRRRLMDAYKSGSLQSDLAQWVTQSKKVVEQNTKTEKSTSRVSQLVKRVGDHFRQSTSKVSEYRDKLSGLERIERNYFSNIRRQITGTIVAYASLHTLRRAALGLVGAGRETESMAFKLSVPFGNKRNAIDAISMAERLGTTGRVPFTKNDLVSGFKGMMEMGIDPTKGRNFQTFGNIAGATGQDLSQVTNDISSAVYGNTDVLRKYGATNQQIFAIDRMANQRPDNRRNTIMNILEGDKRYKNGMKDFASSWAGMTNTISNIWDKFKNDIIGSPKDKNSLYNKIKDTFQMVLNWFEKNKERIHRAAIVISEVLKWVVRQVTTFMRWVAGGIERLLKKTDGSVESFREKTLKIVLWLELTKEKVIRFFDKWGWLIGWIAKIWIGSKIVKLIAGGFGQIFGAGKSLLSLFQGLASAVGMFSRSLSGLMSGGGLLARFAGVLGILTVAGAAFKAAFGQTTEYGHTGAEGVIKRSTDLATMNANKGSIAAESFKKTGSVTDKLSAFKGISDAINNKSVVSAAYTKMRSNSFSPQDNIGGYNSKPYIRKGEMLANTGGAGSAISGVGAVSQAAIEYDKDKNPYLIYTDAMGKQTKFTDPNDPKLQELYKTSGSGNSGGNTINNFDKLVLPNVKNVPDFLKDLKTIQQQGGNQ